MTLHGKPVKASGYGGWVRLEVLVDYFLRDMNQTQESWGLPAIICASRERLPSHMALLEGEMWLEPRVGLVDLCGHHPFDPLEPPLDDSGGQTVGCNKPESLALA